MELVQSTLQVEATITKLLPPADIPFKLNNGSISTHTFEVELGNGDRLLAYLPFHRHYIKILPGDRVKVKLDFNNPTQGRITYRFRKQ